MVSTLELNILVQARHLLVMVMSIEILSCQVSLKV